MCEGTDVMVNTVWQMCAVGIKQFGEVVSVSKTHLPI